MVARTDRCDWLPSAYWQLVELGMMVRRIARGVRGLSNARPLSVKLYAVELRKILVRMGKSAIFDAWCARTGFGSRGYPSVAEWRELCVLCAELMLAHSAEHRRLSLAQYRLLQRGGGYGQAA